MEVAKPTLCLDHYLEFCEDFTKVLCNYKTLNFNNKFISSNMSFYVSIDQRAIGYRETRILDRRWNTRQRMDFTSNSYLYGWSGTLSFVILS